MARLNDEEIQEGLAQLDGWSRESDAIEKVYEREDFLGSVAFLNDLAPVAEEMGHHPDLTISWATVTVTISTHSEGGLTAADFELAGLIDGIA